MYQLTNFKQTIKGGRYIQVRSKTLDSSITLELSRENQQFLLDVYKTSDASNVKVFLQDSFTITALLFFDEKTGRSFIPSDFSFGMKTHIKSVFKLYLRQRRYELKMS